MWNYRKATQHTCRKTLKQECNDAHRKIDQLLDRIVDADSLLVAKALDKQIDELQSQKPVIKEKLSRCGCPLKTCDEICDEMYRTSLRFIQESHKYGLAGGLRISVPC